MICFNNEIWRDFVTYRHLSSDLFLPGIVNHSRIRGAVHYVKIDTRKQCVLGVVVLWCGARLLNTRGRCWAALLSCDFFFPPNTHVTCAENNLSRSQNKQTKSMLTRRFGCKCRRVDRKECLKNYCFRVDVKEVLRAFRSEYTSGRVHSVIGQSPT